MPLQISCADWVRRLVLLLSAVACQSHGANARRPTEGGGAAALAEAESVGAAAPVAAAAQTGGAPHLPLLLVRDVPLPGRATRLDYQDIDAANGHLVIAHMNDGAVLFVNVSDGAVLKRLTGIPVPRGVAVASDAGLVFVTSAPRSLVLIDAKSMTEQRRVETGNGPDGVAWDPTDRVVGVSDQRDGALSLIANAGAGPRRAVKLGEETGNVAFDAGLGWFWITVVAGKGPNRLVAVRPSNAQLEASIELPGCDSAHGLRLHPNGKSAFVACESNDKLLQVDLGSARVLAALPSGHGPDVLSIDPTLGWLYLAAEGGPLTVYDINRAVMSVVGQDEPGMSAHTVAVDAASHRVFFPLKAGPKGSPVLRIMKPSGT